MNTSALDKIHNAYNPEHDIGPTAPIHWSVAALASLIEKLIDRVDDLEAQNACLLAALKAILAGFENGDFRRTRPCQSDTDPYHPALVSARAAIAEAKAT